MQQKYKGGTNDGLALDFNDKGSSIISSQNSPHSKKQEIFKFNNNEQNKKIFN